MNEKALCTDHRSQLRERLFAYLRTPEGQADLRRAHEEAKRVADLFRKMRDVPRDKLHRQFTI
jgi:hypothetical protein